MIAFFFSAEHLNFYPNQRSDIMSHIHDKLAELGIVIPPPAKPAGAYTPVVRDGLTAYVSGQPAKKDGVVVYAGKVGKDLTAEQGYEAARQCAINSLALIEAFAGGLDNVDRILKVNGYVNSAPDFTQHPKVINGASEFLIKIFGDAGRHARTALGVAALPSDSAVEIEMIVRLKK